MGLRLARPKRTSFSVYACPLFIFQATTKRFSFLLSEARRGVRIGHMCLSLFLDAHRTPVLVVSSGVFIGVAHIQFLFHFFFLFRVFMLSLPIVR